MSKNFLVLVGHGKSEHGGYDPGAVNSKLGLQEHKICVGVVKGIAAELAKYDCIVTVKNFDGSMSLRERIAFANKGKYDAIIETHLNSATDKSAKGTEAYYYTGDTEGQKLADCICKEISSSLGIVQRSNGVDDGGDKPSTYFGIIRETKATAVLVETCFLSNDAEAKKVNETQEQAKAGQAIAQGVIKAYNLKAKAKDPLKELIAQAKSKGILQGEQFWYEVLAGKRQADKKSVADLLRNAVKVV